LKIINLAGRDHLAYLDFNRRILLKRILKEGAPRLNSTIFQYVPVEVHVNTIINFRVE
jgi:hypothetical protein